MTKLMLKDIRDSVIMVSTIAIVGTALHVMGSYADYMEHQKQVLIQELKR